MNNPKGKKTNWFLDYLENNRNNIDFFIGGSLEAMNVTIFSHLTVANLAKFLLEGTLKLIAFPIVLFLMTAEWLWSLTKVGLDWRKGEHGITANVIHAGVMMIAYLLVVAAITISFITTSLLTPVFFVAAFATLTLEAFGSAIYHIYKGCTAKSGEKRKEHLTKAAFLGTFFVIGALLTAMIGVVMIKIAPAISATYAGAGIGASASAFIAKASLWWHSRKHQQDTKQIDSDTDEESLLNEGVTTYTNNFEKTPKPKPKNSHGGASYNGMWSSTPSESTTDSHTSSPATSPA